MLSTFSTPSSNLRTGGKRGGVGVKEEEGVRREKGQEDRGGTRGEGEKRGEDFQLPEAPK